MLATITVETAALLKDHLFAHCTAYVAQRLETAQDAMDAAQAAANQESKSSAGDKYETTRAMMQLEKDMHAGQRAEALRLKKELDTVWLDRPAGRPGPGSLIVTDKAIFFLAVSLGRVIHLNMECVVLSAGSPLGALFMKASAGQKVVFGNITYMIREIR